jgi:hypothetical protein
VGQVADVLELQSSEASGYAPVIMPNTTYGAGRCFVYVSVTQIQAQVTGGAYTEQVLQEYNRIPNATATYTFNGTDYYFRDPWDSIEWAEDFIFSPPFTPGQNFTVTWYSFVNLLSSFLNTDFLSGNISSGLSGGLEGPSIPFMLLQSDNVIGAIQNMAQDMTISLRSNDT